MPDEPREKEEQPLDPPAGEGTERQVEPPGPEEGGPPPSGEASGGEGKAGEPDAPPGGGEGPEPAGPEAGGEGAPAPAPGEGAEEAALFEGDPGVEELHQAVDAALSGGGEKAGDTEGAAVPAGAAEAAEGVETGPESPRSPEPEGEPVGETFLEEEDEEDYEFDLDGISLDEPSEGGEEEETAREGPAPPAGGEEEKPAPTPGEDPWPEDEKEGLPLFALLREKFAGIPRRKLGTWAVLVVAPLLAVLLLGIPARKIEKVPPSRIPNARPLRSPSPPERGIPQAVPGYLPPVEAVRPLPPRPNDRPPLWAAAEQKAQAGDYAGAIILLEKFLAGNPPLGPEEKSAAWYDLSRWYRKVGDKEASRKYFSMALDTTWSSLGPKDLFLGGLALHKAGKYRQARRYFAAFLLQEDLMVPELKKKISQAWYLLAEGYRLEAEAGEKVQERREEAFQKAAAGKKGGKR